jgi:hypothetical protein
MFLLPSADVSRATSYNTQISPTITETFLKFAEMRPQDQGIFTYLTTIAKHLN